MMKKGLLLGWLVVCFLFTYMSYCQKSSKITIKEDTTIAFLSNRDAQKGQFDIFIMNLDGSHPINLTDNLHSIRSISRPILSPDEKEILFISFLSEGTSLQTLNIQTRSLVTLSDIGHDVPQASFSPNGAKILFVKKIDGHKQIFMINRDGKEEKNLSNNDYDEFDPSFSPDESKIVFISRRTGPASVWLMDTTGSNQEHIIALAGDCRHPRISPDGKKVVFHSMRNNKNSIYLAKIGHKARLIRENDVNDVNPQFSPDGTKILFQSNQRGMRFIDILLVDIKTNKITIISDQLNYINQNPLFSSNGKIILFESIVFGNSEIYLADANGGKPINLTNNPSWDCSQSF